MFSSRPLHILEIVSADCSGPAQLTYLRGRGRRSPRVPIEHGLGGGETRRHGRPVSAELSRKEEQSWK
jgi:hypothetical protein